MEIDLLLLGALRKLGSGCIFDVIEELKNVNEATNRKFFHEKVCRWVTGLSKVWINLPHNEAEL